MIYLDAHVHIQKSFNLDQFLLSTLDNFNRQRVATAPDSPGMYYLLLTEARTFNFFSVLAEQARQSTGLLASSWQLRPTGESEAIQLQHTSQPASCMFVVAGRQLVTKERIEVLALVTSARIGDGKLLTDTIEEVRNCGGLAVLPWGFGKWLGKRGRIISDFLGSASSESLFVGDNGGRPNFWPRPAPFDLAAHRGIRLLPGSDTLPLSGEELRAGTYGAMLEGYCTHEKPVADLKRLLLDSDGPIIPFGKRPGVWQFLRTQIGLRLAR